MAKNAYIGIDDVAKKIKKMYMGIDGVAKKIKKAYFGVDGVARLIYQAIERVTHPTVALTANESNGYVAEASTHNSTSYAAWKAFNKTNTDAYGWVSKEIDNQKYIQLKMTEALKEIKVTISNRVHDSYVNGIIAGTIYGSNDGSTWTSICTITGRDGATSGYSNEYTCTNTDVAYQYVRVKATNWKNKGGDQSYVAVGEISITGLREV